MCDSTGRFSPKFDEWCFTYCSQTVSGRIHSREPNCRSICIRKVFPHEVRNVLSFKRHQSVGPDGKARYPLPSEGQSANLPRVLGGTPKDDSEDAPKVPTAGPTKYWDEGWYVWTGKGRFAGMEKIEKMILDLPLQQKLEKIRESRKEVWHDYEERLKQNTGQQDVRNQVGPQWWGPLVAPKTIEDAKCVAVNSIASLSSNDITLSGLHLFLYPYHRTFHQYGAKSINY